MYKVNLAYHLLIKNIVDIYLPSSGARRTKYVVAVTCSSKSKNHNLDFRELCEVVSLLAKASNNVVLFVIQSAHNARKHLKTTNMCFKVIENLFSIGLKLD